MTIKEWTALAAFPAQYARPSAQIDTRVLANRVI